MDETDQIFPQNNGLLLGHTEMENLFLHLWKSGKLPQSWIISGPQGIGKATLAYRIARFLFSADSNKKEEYNSLNVAENSPIFKQVADRSYPDFLVVERDLTETDKKKVIKAIENGEALNDEQLSKLKKSAYIRVDDIRKVNEFLAKTSFNNSWRVVIIDSADDMNSSAANALLKILEEPPAKAVILLISHNPGVLLPTIRSRCTKLQLHILDDNMVASLLRRYRTDLNETQISKIVELCNGSIGKAIIYADSDILPMYDDLCAILYTKSRFSLQKLLDFCDEVCADDNKFTLLQELILRFLKENMSTGKDQEGLYACFEATREMFYACESVNMDKKNMLITLLTKICKVL